MNYFFANEDKEMWRGIKKISNLISLVFLFSVMWYILIKTGSILYTGSVLFFSELPYLLFKPLSKLLFAKYKAKNIIILSNLINSSLIFSTAFLIEEKDIGLGIVYFSVTLIFIIKAITENTILNFNFFSNINDNNNIDYFNKIFDDFTIVTAVGLTSILLSFFDIYLVLILLSLFFFSASYLGTYIKNKD